VKRRGVEKSRKRGNGGDKKREGGRVRM